MKRLLFDLDGTLTQDDQNIGYAYKRPNESVIERLKEYHSLGFEIVISTARNMRTHSNNIGKINAKTLPEIINWLEQNKIPFDEIHVGKPWCGDEGFHIDDKAIRPSEFVSMSYEDIQNLLFCERDGHIEK